MPTARLCSGQVLRGLLPSCGGEGPEGGGRGPGSATCHSTRASYLQPPRPYFAPARVSSEENHCAPHREDGVATTRKCLKQ